MPIGGAGGANSGTAPGTDARATSRASSASKVTPAYLDVRGEPEPPDDLLRHECLRSTLVPAGSEGCFTDRRRARANPVRGRDAPDHQGSIREAALQGLGVAWQPRFRVDDDVSAGRLRAPLTT